MESISNGASFELKRIIAESIQLAHQQPSDEGKWQRLSGGGLLYDSKEQASAPTPEVEKIARELAKDDRLWNTQDMVEVSLLKFAVQARAPLVAALKRMPELAYEVLITRESTIRPIDLAMKLQCICDAALTGTEEK